MTSRKIFDSHKKHVKIKIFSVVMPSEDTKILEFNKYQKPHPKDIMQIINFGENISKNTRSKCSQ